MRQFRPDDSFFPSPRLAMQAPPETLAYVSLANPTRRNRPDALGVVDLDPRSRDYGTLVGQVDMPHAGDEIRYFGWNACSSCLCPYAPRPQIERRCLVVPGTRSSRVHIVDTRPDSRNPRIVKVIEPDMLARLTGYARPSVARSGPESIYVNALGIPGGEGPGGLFVMDPETFDVRGRWEIDSGPEAAPGDFAWHLAEDTLLTGEWGDVTLVERGVALDALQAGRYGHRLHVWDRRRRRHEQTLDLGPDAQMVLPLRAAHAPSRAYGFAGVVSSRSDLSASVWLWYRATGNGPERWSTTKILDIPAEPADGPGLPDIVRASGVVPPLLTDLSLSLDDRYLYVSCWGTGELRQYDVANPFEPGLVSTVQLGGIVRRSPHPAHPDMRLTGGPQTIELSRDGRRVYVTNSMCLAWDDQFYPSGIGGWMAKLDALPGGGLRPDERFFLPLDEWRPHDIHLDGGDASSDSYCYA